MIKIPSDLLSMDELIEASGKEASDIDIEIANITFSKLNSLINVELRLNFDLPKKYERLLTKRINSKLGTNNKISYAYIYTGFKKPETGVNDYDESENKSDSRGNGVRWRNKNHKDAKGYTNNLGEYILIGKDFSDNSIDYSEALEYVGDKHQVTLQGHIFKIEIKPMNTTTDILSIVIVNRKTSFAAKSFLSKEKSAEITAELNVDDEVKIKGFVEFDVYDHENKLKIKSLKKIHTPVKIDSHDGDKRVELHCHSQMSDNDGISTPEEIVATAVNWGQKAVAITDHGVVQAFPDAAKEAAKWAKKGKEIKVIYGLEGYLYPDEDAKKPDGSIDIKKNRTYHIILLAKNQEGIKNLYKLVSTSHIDYFYKKPRLPRSVIDVHRAGLIIGSACEAGEVYQSVVAGKNDDELKRIASYYDYLEIQPLGNNQFMIQEGIAKDNDELISFNKKVLEIGDLIGVPTVATTDAHYPTPEAAIYRNIIMNAIGYKDTQSDSLYMRTTDEMLKEFEYLGDRAEEVVITNTNKIANMIGEASPVPKGKFPPKIEGADEKLRTSCYEKAKSIYGDPIPSAIEKRLNNELDSIIGNGYAVMYLAAKLVVDKSMNDGYLVGSRGSVGSSFAATMAGITEVNPLEPHYICPNCKKFAWCDEPDKYDTGFDMPDRKCPVCGAMMNKDGFNIPFATFLGFKGDKEPDIDLNFAGEYQATIHKYVGEIFGEENVFKAGTVARIKAKTAYGYVKKYVDENNLNLSRHDIDYLSTRCEGVKRTTGQHPGGIIVLPKDKEIYEFCPIQKPANKRDSDVITTHFDYHKIDENLLKLDLLGHDGPQLLRHLQDMTGVSPMDIRLDDPQTMSIFTSIDELNIKYPDYRFTHGTYAIPEFGTHFTRQMLDDINPKSISDLIKMSGFSHGTAVWTGNAQDLIRKKVATVNEVISCRDDIMHYLMNIGIENSEAFKIMEIVRKNKPLSDEHIDLMKSHGVPDWYIQSCKTLTYLFPRAHATAYVMTSLRMAWFKVHHPMEFYAAWFTSKVDAFDADIIYSDFKDIEKKMDDIEAMGKRATTKETDMLTVYEVVYEMMARGYVFTDPVLGVAEASRFKVVDNKIMLPFNAINGIGRLAAESLIDEYNERKFTTIDDVRSRTKLSAVNIEDLKKHGLFDGMPESAQMSIFELGA